MAVVSWWRVAAAASAVAEAAFGGGFRGGGFHGGGFRAAVLRSMAEGSEGGVAIHRVAAFVPRRCSGGEWLSRGARSSPGGASRADIVTPITGRISITTGVTSIDASTRRVLLVGYPYYHGYRHRWRHCRSIGTNCQPCGLIQVVKRGRQSPKLRLSVLVRIS